MSWKVRQCAVCPKFERGWCVHLATIRPPNASSCEYGNKAMKNEILKETNRKKFGRKRREPKWEDRP